ncbi:MAG: Unknown protein [uncultured Sulfurovum sp.]|uniref:Glycosyltransferase 2-like domain-containing protein n=1 Tax=uncultured Sulfurovum sp. TaxID=269237 RepID=A0A6S6TKI4_9BACT|nr:MAG: Unknown protein [uncultured Sulfurovum sp.]
MNNTLITIAIPTYNNAQTIASTIESCINQKTDIDYEILIVNNASKDGTDEVIAQYSDNDKIKVINNPETVGLYDNHNLCLEHGSGDYLVYCHSDDILEDNTVETFAKKLAERNYPKKYIVWGHSMFRDFSQKFIKYAGFSYNQVVVGEYAPMAFLYGGLTPSGTCFSRESFFKYGGYIPTTHPQAPSDMTTMIYLAMNGFKFEMINDMVFMREHASTALANGLDTYLGEIDDAYKHFMEHVEKEKVSKLIKLSSGQKNKPYYFYYAIAQAKEHKKQIRTIVLKNIVKEPWILTQPLTYKLLKRLA